MKFKSLGKWVRWCIADSWNETREDMEVLNEWLLAEHLNITYHRPLLRYLNSCERRDNGIPDFWELPSIHRNPRSFAARKGFPMSCKRCIVPKVKLKLCCSSFFQFHNLWKYQLFRKLYHVQMFKAQIGIVLEGTLFDIHITFFFLK